MYQHLINTLFANWIGSKWLPLPLSVWSNYPVKISYAPADDGIIYNGSNIPALLKTNDLDVERLYTFAQEMREGYLFIDELDLIADKQDWQSGGQKLLMAILRQIRKRHLSMTGSIQSMSWLNPRFIFHLDTTISCKDAAATVWGQDNNVDSGDMTFLKAKDMSGINTGNSYEETGQIFESRFKGKRIQQFYDTDQEFNPFEHMVRYTVKRKQKEINPFAKETEEQEEREATGINEAIAEILRERIASGQNRMTTADFNRLLKARGLRVSKGVLLDHLQDVHNVSNYAKMGYFYLRLDEVVNV